MLLFEIGFVLGLFGIEIGFNWLKLALIGFELGLFFFQIAVFDAKLGKIGFVLNNRVNL